MYSVTKGFDMRIRYWLVCILSIIAFGLLFFSPFGPINDKFVPYHPIGWAGICTYFAMLLSFSCKYKKTKDNFWLIVTAGFFPLLISDLYFFPIPKVFGLGMLEWAGVQFIVFLLGFIIYTKLRMLRYSNLIMLILTPIIGMATLSPDENMFLTPFKILSLLFLIVTACSLSFYAFQQKNYLFIIGVVANFMIANVIVTIYFATGVIVFGWEHLFMAVITDRIAIFGRILMTLSSLFE